jgi:hypothetical protein
MALTRTGYANLAAFPVTGAVNVIYVDLSNGNEYLWVTNAYVAYTGTLAGVRTAYEDSAWFTANPTFLLGKGQRVDLLQTGTYKLGDGVTALSGLTFLGGSTAYTGSNGITLTGSNFTLDNSYFTGEAGLAAGVVTLSNSAVISKVLTGYTSGAGVVAATDTILQAIQKLNGNISAIPTYTSDESTLTLTGSTFSIKSQTSATFMAKISDATGSGVMVRGTSPTFTTNITTPSITGVNGSLSIANTAQATGSVIDLTFTGASHTGQTASTTIDRIFINPGTRQWLNGNIASIQQEIEINGPTYSFVGPGSSTITNAATVLIKPPSAGTNAIITNRYAAILNGRTWVLNNSAGSVSAISGTQLTVENNGTNYISFLQPDNASGGMVWGSPTDSFGAVINWMLNNNALDIQTARTNGIIRFYPGDQNLRLTLSTTQLTFADAVDMVFNTTTGTKIGTATTQKIGFWNATPIVQPTTAVAASTLTSNGGTTLTSTDTIDGYTLLQVVKALRNTGLLA